MNRAGLRKIVRSVHGRKGTVRRTYWMRSATVKPKAAVRAIQAVVGAPADYKSHPTFATAKANFKIGAFSTLAGLHRAERERGVPIQLAAHGFGNYATHVMRSHFHKRETADQYLKNGLVGHAAMAAGQVAGAFAHEGIRHLAKKVRG